MDEDVIVREIVKSLAFEIEATNEDNVLKWTTTNGTPLSVKVRVRNPDEPRLVKKGPIPVPRIGITAPDRLRLVSSDQTILSFNIYLDKEAEKQEEYKRSKFFQIFNIGGCLGTTSDDDGPYLPSSSNQKAIEHKSNSRSESAIFGSISNTIPAQNETKKEPFGKCKPGGCLDPPFGEDRYPYSPSKTDRRTKLALEIRELEKKQTPGGRVDSILTEKLQLKTRSKENNQQKVDTERHEQEQKKEIDVIRGSSAETSRKSKEESLQCRSSVHITSEDEVYSKKLNDIYARNSRENSLITYHIDTSSTESLYGPIPNKRASIKSNNESQRQTYEYPESYFVPPKDVLRYKEEERRYSKEPSNYQIGGSGLSKENDVADKINLIKAAQIEHKPISQNARGSKDINMKKLKLTLTELQPDSVDVAQKVTANKISPTHLASDSKEPVSYILTDSKTIDDHRNVPDKIVEPDFNTTAKSNIVEQDVDHSKLQKQKKNRSENVDIVNIEAKSDILINECSVAKSVDILLSTGEINKPIKSQSTPLSDTNINVFADAVETNSQILDINPNTYSGIINDKIGMLNNKLPSNVTTDVYSDRKKVKDKPHEKPTMNDNMGMLNNKLPSSYTTDLYSDRKEVKDMSHEKPTLNDKIGMLNSKLPSSDTIDLYSDRKNVKDKPHEKPTLNDKIGMLNNKLPSSETTDLYSYRKKVKDKSYEKPTLLESRSNVVKVAGSSYQDVSSKADQTLPMNDLHKNLKTDIYTTPSADIETKTSSQSTVVGSPYMQKECSQDAQHEFKDSNIRLSRESKTMDPEALSIDKIKTGSLAEKIVVDHDQQKTSTQDSKSTRELEPNKVSNRQFIPGYKDVEDTVKNNDDKTTLYVGSKTESQITKDKPNVKAKEREYATLNPEVQRPETSVQNENIKNIGKNLSPSGKSSYENKEFDVSSTHSIDFMPKHPSSNASNDEVDTISKKQTSAILHKTLFIPRTDLDIHDDDMNKTTQLKRQTFTIIRSDTSLPKQEEIEETPKDVTNIYLKATDNAKSVSPSQTLDKTDILDARSKKLDTKMQSNTSVEPPHKMTEKYVNKDTRSKRLDTKMQSNTSVEPPHRMTQENLNKNGSKITDLHKSVSNDQANIKPENLNRSNKDPENFRDVSLSGKTLENNKDTSYEYASDRHGLLGSQNRDELDTKTTEGNKEYNNKLYDVSSGNVFEKPLTQLYSKDTDYVSPAQQVSSKAALSTSNKDLEERTNGDSVISSAISQKPKTQLYSKDADYVSPSMQVSGKAALRTSNKDLEKITNRDSAITSTISQEHRQESIEPPKLTGNGKYVLSSENRDNTEVGFSDTKSHRKADMHLRSTESDTFSLTSEDHDTDTTDNMSKAQEKVIQKKTTASSHESVPENLHSKNTNDDILVPVLPVINETGLYVKQNGSDLGISEKSVQENVKDLYAHVTDDGKLAQYIQNRDKSETLSITNKLIENRKSADGTSIKPIPQNENEVISEDIDYASPATQVIEKSEALSTGDKDLEARTNGDTAISTTISQEHIQKSIEPLKLTGNSKSVLYPENSDNTEVDFSDAKGYKKADLLLINTERDTFSLTSDEKLVAVVPKSNRTEHLVKSYKEPEDKIKLEDAKYKDMDGAYSINSTLGENSSSELFPEVPNIAQVTEHDKYIVPNQPYTELIDTDSNQPQIKIPKEKPKQSDVSDYHGMKKASDFTETLAEGYSELSDNLKSVSEKSSPHSGYSGILSEVLSNISEKAEEEERITKTIMERKTTLEIDKDLLQINNKVNQDNELLGDKFSHRTEESIPTMPIIPGSNIEFASKLDENVYNVPKNTLENPSISTFEINRDTNNKTVTEAFETVKHMINDSDQLKQQSNDYQTIINKPVNIHRDVAFNEISEVENPTDYRSSKVPISVNYNIDLKRESFGTKPFIYNSGEEEKERTSPSHQVIRENGGLSQNGISYLDMSFYSYINNDNQRVVQTHSPPNEQQHRNDATVTVVKTLIRHGKEIRIPVDTENDLTLNIVDKDSVICNAGSNIASPTTYRHREHQIVDRTKKQDILTKNLALIYESGLIPLHNVIKDLTQQVNTLTSKQETLQELKLSAKRSKSLRLIPVVKGCGCKRI